LGQKLVQRKGRLRDRRKQAAVVIKPQPGHIGGCLGRFREKRWLLCFPGRFVFGPGRSRQEQSDRREPVPAEHESLTLKNVQAAVSGRLRVSGATTSRGSTSFPPGRVRHGLPLLSGLAKLRCVGSSASSALRAGLSSYRTRSLSIGGDLNCQSVKTTERGGARGFYAHKRVKGPKRHILVDTLGLLVANRVEPADTSDRRAGALLLGGLRHCFRASGR
jgi:hypothetical protein